MLRFFISPKGERLSSKDCLEKGLLSEYYPLSYLHMCASERPWTGKPSTTQLLNGTRLEYLRLLTPYSLDPSDESFRIMGSRAHQTMEKLTPQCSFSELSIPDEEITGISDLLEEQPNSEWWLSDIKYCGSYKVLQALGLVKKKRPAFDEEGNPVLYQRNGAGFKKGDQKTEDYFEEDTGTIHIPEWELQVNRYRVVIEKYFGITIAQMRIFMVVRDGNTSVAESRGVTRNTYYVPIKRLEDDHVNSFFEEKRKVLVAAIENYLKEEQSAMKGKEYDYAVLKEHLPTICTDEENWNGKRCKEYCPVFKLCAWFGNPYLSEVRDRFEKDRTAGTPIQP